MLTLLAALQRICCVGAFQPVKTMIRGGYVWTPFLAQGRVSYCVSSSMVFRKQLTRPHSTRTYSRDNTFILKMSATGFIGLGIMGEGMAARLLSQGVAGTEENPLVVWNRTGSKCSELAAKFPDKKVIIKDTAKEVVEACGVTYSMLSTPEASKAVFEAEAGVLAGVSAGKSIVDCATLAEADMVRMNEAVVAKGG